MGFKQTSSGEDEINTPSKSQIFSFVSQT